MTPIGSASPRNRPSRRLRPGYAPIPQSLRLRPVPCRPARALWRGAVAAPGEGLQAGADAQEGEIGAFQQGKNMPLARGKAQWP